MAQPWASMPESLTQLSQAAGSPPLPAVPLLPPTPLAPPPVPLVPLAPLLEPPVPLEPLAPLLEPAEPAVPPVPLVPAEPPTVPAEPAVAGAPPAPLLSSLLEQLKTTRPASANKAARLHTPSKRIFRFSSRAPNIVLFAGFEVAETPIRGNAKRSLCR
jgi:hypothetical protein